MLIGSLVISALVLLLYRYFFSLGEKEVIVNICGLCIVFLRYGFEEASRAGCLTRACVFTLICLSCLLSGPVKRVVTDDVNY